MHITIELDNTDHVIIEGYKDIYDINSLSQRIIFSFNEAKPFLQFAFDDIPDPDRTNLDTIIKIIAQDKEHQNPVTLKRLADYCFASKIKSIWENDEQDSDTIQTEEYLKDKLKSVNNEMLYMCETSLQLIYSLEMICLRTGRHIRHCKFCGERFITKNNSYCSDECARKARREQEKKSHNNLPEEVKLWRKIQQRKSAQIKRETNSIRKSRLEKEYEKLKLEKENMKDSGNNAQYIHWLKEIERR